MAIRNIRRQASNPLAAPGTPTSAPIYVDSDDNIVKVIPAGSGTTEVQIVDASSSQTLTNKTLTAPTLTAPVITGVGSYVEPSEVLTALDTLTSADSGKTIYLNSATEFAVTLPAAALGLNFKFIVKAAPSGASYTVVTPGAPDQIIFGKILSAAGDAGDVENSGGATTITFVDGQAVVGDRVDVSCDGTNWYAIGYASVAAGITFTG